MTRPPLVHDDVLSEQHQGHATRKGLFDKLLLAIGRPIVSLFTSFRYPVMIEDEDADMLEGVLRSMDLSNGFALCINSPGGDLLAAERIVNLCRAYSGTGEYWAVVPGKAKSAGTMICFGASKIIMGPTSELGPVDPQFRDGDRVFSVYNVVRSYEELFQRAVAEPGNLQPYLQQLQRYDEREIAEMRAALDLSQDIAARTLRTGMMCGATDGDVVRKIAMFLTPEQAKTHGRPIYRDGAPACGLHIEAVEPTDAFWSLTYELYIRTNNLVQNHTAKCIESAEHSYAVAWSA